MRMFGIASLTLVCALGARAEEEPDRFAKALTQIERAKAAIAAKNAPDAIEALRQAIRDLGGLESFLPTVDGWKRGEPSVRSGRAQDKDGKPLGRVTVVRANYVGPGRKELTVTIMSSAGAAEEQRQFIDTVAQADRALKMANKGKSKSDREFRHDDGWTIMLASLEKSSTVYMVGVWKDLVVRVDTDQASAATVKKVFARIDRAALKRLREDG